MVFDPKKRIQTAAALQGELKKAMAILEAGKSGKGQEVFNTSASGNPDEDEVPTNEGEGYVVLLVESKANLQDAIRERLKSRGYRVLVIANPNRALARFSPEGRSPC